MPGVRWLAALFGSLALSVGACGSTSDERGPLGVTDGGGATSSGGDQCPAYCAKLTHAGCAPDDCVLDCASKTTCVGAWIALVSCVAETGSVTCDADQPTFAGCKTQYQAHVNCLTPSGGGTGGVSSGTCNGSCQLDGEPVPGSNPPCFCDAACSDPANDDCCSDKETFCPTPPPEPTCKRFCCGASDCGEGEICAAIDARLGTIGVCQLGGAPRTDSGVAGAPADAGSLGLPAGCVLSTVACNPLTNAACATGQACELTTGGSFQCLDPPNDAQPGGACKDDGRPHCIGGYHCSA